MRILVKIFAILLIFGCENDEGMGPDVEDFTYPIAVGNQWQYTTTITMVNFRPAMPGNTFDDTTITRMAAVEIIGVDTVDAKAVHVFRELRNQLEAVAYYRNETEGLFLFQGFSDVLPKAAASSLFPEFDIRFNGVHLTALSMPGSSVSSARHFQEPALILKYPLQVGEKWVVQDSTLLGETNIVEKEIVGTETVETDAGEFDCFRIQWFASQQPNLEQVDFVSAQGLIRRVSVVKDIVLTTETSPEPLGLIDIRTATELTGLQLQQ